MCVLLSLFLLPLNPRRKSLKRMMKRYNRRSKDMKSFVATNIHFCEGVAITTKNDDKIFNDEG